jgi:hypothetical protein
MKLAKGQIVTITAEVGVCMGHVLEVGTPEELPSLPFPAPTVRKVKAILQEFEINQIALIQHQHGDSVVMFWALHNEQRGWFDLQRQHLHIAPRGLGAAS